MFGIAAIGIGYLVQTGVLTKALPRAIGPVARGLRRHFKQGSRDLHVALEESMEQALAVIGTGVNPGVTSKVKSLAGSRLTKEFQESFQQRYFQPFLQEHSLEGERLKVFRKDCVTACKVVRKNVTKLIPDFDESEIPGLIFPTEASSDDPLQKTQQQSRLDLIEGVRQIGVLGDPELFFAFQDLLFHSLLFFFQERLKTDPRVEAIFRTYRENGIAIDLKTLKVNVLETQQLMVQGQQQLAMQIQELIGRMGQSDPAEQGVIQQQMMELQQHQMAVMQDMQGFGERFAAAEQAIAGLNRSLEQFQANFAAFAQQVTGQLDEIMNHLDVGLEAIQGRLNVMEDRIIDQIDRSESRLVNRLLEATGQGGAGRDPQQEMEMAVSAALDDLVLEQNELKMLYAQAQRWNIPRYEADEIIHRVAERMGGRVLWSAEEQKAWEEEQARQDEPSYHQIELELEELVTGWLAGESLMTEKMQRDFYVEIAMREYPAERAEVFLQLLLDRLGARLESAVVEQVKEYLAPALADGYLSINEGENVIFSAEQCGLQRSKALELIEEQCMRTGCTNALEIANKFRRFLDIQLQGASTLARADTRRLIDWAVKKGLSKRDARSFLYEDCRRRGVTIV